jgi:hypothetical protein
LVADIEGGTRLRVFESRMLRKIFRRKRDKVRGEWRKLHNEELDDLYTSTHSLRVITSKIRRGAGHVVRVEERRGV